VRKSIETRKLEEVFLHAAMGKEPRVRILLRREKKKPDEPPREVERELSYPGPNLSALKWMIEQRAKSAPAGVEPLPFGAWSDAEILKMLEEGKEGSELSAA
jgi:hypothetical protein